MLSIRNLKQLLICLLCLFGIKVGYGQEPLLSFENDQLVYGLYANNGSTIKTNKIPDFSGVGYHGGGINLPEVPVVKTLYPHFGDCLDMIQGAIDSISALPLNANGFRGAILLKAGVYEVSTNIIIANSGIVLRGEGTSKDGTVLICSKRVTGFLKIFGSGDGYGEVSGTRVKVTDSFVPTGTNIINVEAGHSFVAGDDIVLEKNPNQAWVHALGMDAVETPWDPYVVSFERKVIAVNGNQLTLDGPIVDPMEDQYGFADVYKSEMVGRISECGIENIRLETNYASDEDEDHGWRGVYFQRAENCWVKDVVCKYYGLGAVDIDAISRFVTVQDCAMIDPKSITTGSRKYPFNIAEGTSNCLFLRCVTWGGRHDFVAGTGRTPGPNAWVDCVALNSLADSGPHQRWSTGQLYDNVYTKQLKVANRDDAGSGQGWSGAQVLFYNCESPGTGNLENIKVDSPPIARNYAIGCVGAQNFSGAAYNFESWGIPVTPRSLYLQQLKERLGTQAVNNVASSEQLDGTIRNILMAKGNAIYAESRVRIDLGITDNGGVITAQYEAINANQNYDKLIDNTKEKYFINNKNALWVQYQAKVSAKLIRYTLKSAKDVPDRDPKDWTLYGSVNGQDGSWTVLDTRINQVFSYREQTRSFDIANAEPYLFFRLEITDNSGASGTQFDEWEMFEDESITTKLTSFTQANQSGEIKLTWESNAEQNNTHYDLLRSQDGLSFQDVTTIQGNAIANSYTYLDENPLSGVCYYKVNMVDGNGNILDSKIIRLNTNILFLDITDDGGVITDQWNVSDPQYLVTNLIDENTATTYYSAGRKAGWIQYQTHDGATANKYTIVAFGPTRSPKSWTFSGSATGAADSWVVLDTQTGVTFTLGESKIFPITNSTAYNFYRLTISANNGGAGVEFTELEIYGYKALPVELTSFSAKRQDNNVKLSWTTASEQNNSHFDLLRSTNGKDFQSLAIVQGNGTTNAVSRYNYLDVNPISGTSYYKLRQVDYNGESEDSKVISFNNTLQKSTLQANASVSQQQVSLMIFATASGKANIKIMDLLGQIIADKSVKLEEGANHFVVPANLKTGIYIIGFTSAKEQRKVKVLAQ